MLKALESYYCKALQTPKNQRRIFGFVRVRAESPQRLKINRCNLKQQETPKHLPLHHNRPVPSQFHNRIPNNDPLLNNLPTNALLPSSSPTSPSPPTCSTSPSHSETSRHPPPGSTPIPSVHVPASSGPGKPPTFATAGRCAAGSSRLHDHRSGGREGSEEDTTGKLGEAGDEAVAVTAETPALGTCSTTDVHSL